MRSSDELSDPAVQKVVARVADRLVPGEGLVYVGKCMNIRPMLSHFIITDRRLIGMEQKDQTFSHQADRIRGFDFDGRRGRVTVKLVDGGEVTIKNIAVKDMSVVEEVLLDFGLNRSGAPAGPPSTPPVPPPPSVISSTPVSAAPLQGISAGALVRGRPVTKAAQSAIDGVCLPDEEPWLILNPSGATGVLAAFEDRLAIIKVGGLTGLMSGSLMGGRSAVFYFPDITAIEFNAGAINGVLEVLTASYQGSANKDFWRGSLKSRNADSNDPFTLSNTLPMLKSEYEEWQSDVAQLRKRISEAKRPVAHHGVSVGASSMAEELRSLARLHADGVINEDEFAAAKAKLLSS